MLLIPFIQFPFLTALINIFRREHFNRKLKILRGRPFKDFEKKFPASACPKKKIACSTNVIESLWEKKGKKYPAHQIARKKILDDQKSPTPPLKS